MRRRLKHIIILVAIAIVSIWLLEKLNIIPSSKDVFSSKPVVIDKTPILIKEIKSIAELITIAAYDEVVVDSIVISTTNVRSFNTFSPLPVIPIVTKRIVLIGRGKVLAGTQLTNLHKRSIFVEKDTITLKLNHAVILDAIMNPSDFETFDEKGTWSDEAVRAVKMKAKQKMINRALQRNILQKADVKAKAVMENFLLSAGYKKVNVLIE
jgi:hypothetical protein